MKSIDSNIFIQGSPYMYYKHEIPADLSTMKVIMPDKTELFTTQVIVIYYN